MVVGCLAAFENLALQVTWPRKQQLILPSVNLFACDCFGELVWCLIGPKH